MIQVSIVAEFEEDEYGPHSVYSQRLTLPRHFAKDAAEAHARLLKTIASTRYVEIPTVDHDRVPFCTSTIRTLAVWDR